MTDEKCKQYIKSDGLNFCMSSVCPEKDCIYALVNKLHQKIDRLEQENKELKEEIQFHNKENSNLLAERNAAQIGYDEIREVRERYRSALEEIREKIELLNKDICNNCGWYKTDNCQPNGYVCHDLIEIKNKINEVLNHSEG